MIPMRVLATIVLALAAVGCDSSSDAMDMAIASPCSGSLSGAVSETIRACKVTWDEKGGTASLGNDGDLTVSDPSQIVTGASFGFAITVDGDARTGTFSSANVSAYQAGVDVPADGGDVASYVANWSNAVGAPPNLGVVSATITGVTVDFMNATESRWIVHGSLSATLLPVKTIHGFGSGMVTMTLDF